MFLIRCYYLVSTFQQSLLYEWNSYEKLLHITLVPTHAEMYEKLNRTSFHKSISTHIKVIMEVKLVRRWENTYIFTHKYNSSTAQPAQPTPRHSHKLLTHTPKPLLLTQLHCAHHLLHTSLRSNTRSVFVQCKNLTNPVCTIKTLLRAFQKGATSW